ncbi:unnamed protein product, partial [Iphiclides podalirius]
MPYRSKATDYIFKKKKRRRPAYYSDVSTSSDDSTSDSASSSSEFEFRGSKKRWSRRQKKRDVLTPVISYVTRSGRVVYQKKIKKENPSDWLALGKSPQAMAVGSAEMTMLRGLLVAVWWALVCASAGARWGRVWAWPWPWPWAPGYYLASPSPSTSRADAARATCLMFGERVKSHTYIRHYATIVNEMHKTYLHKIRE